jgi:hypothetical protein
VNLELVYLGYILGNGRLKIDLAKVEVIVKWPKPINSIEIGSFLGEIQY